MAELQNDKNFKSVVKKNGLTKTDEEITSYIAALEKANAEIHLSRRAALNALEDAIIAKQALSVSETKLEKELADTKMLQQISNHIIEEDNIQTLYEAILNSAMEIMNAEFASIQLYMPEKQKLFLLAYKGFHPGSAKFWEYVNADSSSSCAKALATNKRVIVKDIDNCPFKMDKGDYDAYRLSGIVSVQSTPLISRAGTHVGMISTHWRNIHESSEHEFYLFDVLVRQLADLIEKRMAEEALRKSEEQLMQFNIALEKKVAEGAADLIKQHNLLKQAEELAQAGSWEYNIITNEFIWSDGMYRLFEMKKGRRVTPEIYIEYAFKDDEQVAKKIVAAIRENFEPIEEIMRIKFNGSYKTVQIKAAPLKNEKDEIEKMLGVDVDISQARQSEEKIKTLNKSLSATNKELNSLNTELKTFTSIAANNYVETLRHVYINLEMIVTNDARNLSNSGRANLRRAQGAIQKMKLTTDDLISFSRLNEIGIKENNIDLNSIVKNVIDDFRKQPVYSLIKINCDHLPFISGYPSLLTLLFHHLIDNAIKFRKSDKDHAVHVTCKEFISGNDIAQEGVEKNIEYHVISVEDNGIGFPQTESEKIFEMFYRLNEKTKYKGSGTGLALCKKIIEMHGGFITAKGSPDEGASFHCFFPVRGGG